MSEQIRETAVSAMLAFIILYAAVLFSPYVLLKVMVRVYHLVVPPSGLWRGGDGWGGMGEVK